MTNLSSSLPARVRILVGALALVTLTSVAAPAGAAPPERGSFPVAEVVRFEAAPGTVLSVPGVGRFVGALEVIKRRDGRLLLVNDLPMDAYIEGLAEMPASWPTEALKAQAVAARTYAWYSIELATFRERGLPYDICATVDCQVFAGRGFVESTNGPRWQEAVAATSGQVLVHDGAPILARFFSSSGGHTRNNEHVFGHGRNEGPRPYLKGVADPEDRISPWHRWQLTLTQAELNAVLARGATVAAAVPVAKVERVVGLPGQVDQLRFTSRSGRTVQMSASKFRRFLAEVGPALFPHRFPGRGAGGKALPEAVPTSRLAFSFARVPGHVVIEGQGWGHGVGMSQWGARGKAEQGWRYDDILAAYYQDLRPTTPAELPATVRVGLRDGLASVIVRADGPYRVVQDGQAVDLRGGGKGWALRALGPRSLRATGPVVSWVPHDAAAPVADAPPPPAVTAPPPPAPPPSPVGDDGEGFAGRLRDAFVTIARARLSGLLNPLGGD